MLENMCHKHEYFEFYLKTFDLAFYLTSCNTFLITFQRVYYLMRRVKGMYE